MRISITIKQSSQKYSFKKLHCHGTYKNHAKPFSKCIVKSIAFVSLQFKKEFEKRRYYVQCFFIERKFNVLRIVLFSFRYF